MDFGAVMLANSVSSPCDDIFGSTVNVCSKINRLAEPNGMVIGNDMYQIVKDFDEYSFKSTSDYSLGLLQRYPVYSVLKK
jgi:class 3 adenylate cyclase